MKLLLNAKDWEKFNRYYKPGLTTKAPNSYPCYVYVSDEFRIKYLYPDDVFNMAQKIREVS